MINGLPNIYYFNPTSEMAVANGNVSWQPNRILQQFEQDIELIIAFLANKEDIVLLRKIPSQNHLAKLEKMGVKLPQLKQLEDSFGDRGFTSRPKGNLNPWGWSPAMVKLFEPIHSSSQTNFALSNTVNWNASTKELFSRKTALKVLKELIKSDQTGITTEKELPIICTSIDQVVNCHKTNKRSILKAPWSSSGRGLQTIDRDEIHPQIINWSKGILKDQGYLMVEPLLDKQFDFAFQFEIKQKEIKYLGTSWFKTNDKKAYSGNYLKKEFAQIPIEFEELLSKNEVQIVENLSKSLAKTYLGNYEGMAGIDAMFIKNNNKESLIHPCVEINLRYNMGNIAQALSPFIEKGFSTFEISTINDFEAKNLTKAFLLTEGEKFCAYLC